MKTITREGQIMRAIVSGRFACPACTSPGPHQDNCRLPPILYFRCRSCDMHIKAEDVGGCLDITPPPAAPLG